MQLQKMILCALCLIGQVFPTITYATAVLDAEDLLDMSFEDLMDVEIISASRQRQSATEVAVPVSVLTADEIHQSGVTNIPEALQLMPGVDVRRLDRTRYMVGVRGMFSDTSDRTLVLINGRDALNPAIAAPDWLNLPVLLEDIERIEVVRGPGSATWGANAYTGVINIITRAPRDETSMVHTTINEFGDSYNHVRIAGQQGLCAWRASIGYEDMENSDQAGAGTMLSDYPLLNGIMGFNQYQARDFARVWRFDSEVDLQVMEHSRLAVGLAHSDSQQGDREFVGRFPQRDMDTRHTRFFSQWRQEHSESAHTTVQWYANNFRAHTPQIMSRYEYWQNDVELRHHTQPHEDHQLSLGANIRTLQLKTRNDVLPGEVDYPDKENEFWAGLSLTDHIKVSDQWSVEGQGRLDTYCESEWDWSARLAAIRSLDQDKQHRLRWGVARAFRAPGVALRETTLVGSGGLFNIVPNRSSLKNETTYALEFGYLGQWTPWMNVHVNTFYQRMEDIIGSINEKFGPVTNSYFANVDGADTYGLELESVFTWPFGHLRLWYTLHHVSQDTPEQSYRANLPARHKAGALGIWRINQAWRGAVNYVYNDGYDPTGSGSGAIHHAGVHRMDLTLSRLFVKPRSEIMIGVMNVLNEHHPVGIDISEFTTYTTPGRTFFVRGQIGF